MLNIDLHLIGFDQKCHDGVLVAGTADVDAVDAQDAVAHSKPASSGRSTTWDNLEQATRVGLRSRHATKVSVHG